MAVAGPDFDPFTLPSPPAISFYADPALSRAGLAAVARLRQVSYRQRGIQLVNGEAQAILERDRRSIHFILHLGNCVHGAIRVQFFDRNAPAGSDNSLYREILCRQPQGGIRSMDAVAVAIDDSESSKYIEISSWMVNPAIRATRMAAVILASAPWALGGLMDPFSGICSARGSNGVSRTLEHFGCQPVVVNGSPLEVDDPVYRGPVIFMAVHSRRFHPKLTLVVDRCAEIIKANGLVVAKQ